MKVYQLERLKQKQIFDDVLAPTFDVFLFESPDEAIKAATDYCEKIIARYDHMKLNQPSSNENNYSFFIERPTSFSLDTPLNWTMKAYIEDVVHEIRLCVKENNIKLKEQL